MGESFRVRGIAMMCVKGLALGPDEGCPVEGHCGDDQGPETWLDPVKVVK